MYWLWRRASRGRGLRHARPCPDCICGTRSISGDDDGACIPLGVGIGSAWAQIRTIDRIDTEAGGRAQSA